MLVRPLQRPLVTALDGPMRAGLPWEAPGGGTWWPLFEPTLIEGWRADTALANGAVSSWLGVKLGTNLAQGTGAQQPTRGATSINGYPGVSFDGGDILSGSINLSAYSAVRVVAAVIDTATALSIIAEYGANTSTTNGSWAASVNDIAAGTLECAARGTANVGARRSDNTHGIATAKVVTWCPDTSLANGTRFIRENGTQVDSVDVVATCGAGNFGNLTLQVGARSGLALPWTGVLGQLWILSGNTQDAALDRVERWVGQRVGLSW